MRLPKTCLLFLLITSVSARAQLHLPELSRDDLAWIGDRIFQNECRRQVSCLLSWNQGENFPSLGIGHFIWYRAGQDEGFTETFPGLLRFLQSRGAEPPEWIAAAGYEQPWPDRDAFLAARRGPELESLGRLLEHTVPEQTAYIVSRFEPGLNLMLDSTGPARRAALERRINNILRSAPRLGTYALVDYIHFKGEGVSAGERYQGQGWGLLQVLEAMPLQSDAPLHDFVAAADLVLTRRVANAPADKDEQRWLPGWRNRLQTYLQE